MKYNTKAVILWCRKIFIRATDVIPFLISPFSFRPFKGGRVTSSIWEATPMPDPPLPLSPPLHDGERVGG
jgi:hypothetical protein